MTLLERVLEPGQLSVLFQPILRHDGAGWHLHAFEGLVRGPAETNVSTPEVLFAYARRKRAEAAVDKACVRAILEAAVPLGPDAYVNINVHGITLEQDLSFVAQVAELLDFMRVAPSRLTLEIVEHSASTCGARFGSALAALRGLGVRIALDDIGLGQSNYRMIIETRPDFFKIDRYLIAGCARDAYKRAIVGSIGHLAHSLDAYAVAEGVENVQDLSAVVSEGVETIQGYLLALPRGAGALGPSGAVAMAARLLPSVGEPMWADCGDWLTLAAQLRADPITDDFRTA
jgi:EAL domain-containing protein (putative c-di-GMP-specific phosphodiesterase class I)